jgi:hypothetical protein
MQYEMNPFDNFETFNNTSSPAKINKTDFITPDKDIFRKISEDI